MKASLLLFFCCLFVNNIHGQYTTMVGKKYSQKVESIHQLYNAVIDKHIDSLSLADTLTGMRVLAHRKKDIELDLEADLLEIYYHYRMGSNNIEKFLKLFDKSIRKKIYHISLRSAHVIASHYWKSANYEAAMRWYQQLDELLSKVSLEEFPNRVEYLKEIGTAYYNFRDYEKAIYYFNQVTHLPLKIFYEKAWTHAVNTMGLIYQEIGQFDESDLFFQKIIDSIGYQSEVWTGIATGNMGYNHFLRGNISKAKGMLLKDIEIAEKYEDWGLAAGSYIPMAAIYLQEGKFVKAGKHLELAKQYIQKSGQIDRLRLLYPVLSKWYTAINQPIHAASYLDSALLANKQYTDKLHALKLLLVQQQFQASQKVAIQKALDIEVQQQVNRRNLFLSSITILILIILMTTIWQHQRNRMKIKERDLRLVAADQELKLIRQQLDELARKASQSQELQNSDENGKLVEQLNRHVILTDEGWATFSALFGKLYPGFLHELKRQYPVLTPAEIRCLAMEKLHYTNKEMAALQGISANAITVTKHRIRRKLGLQTQADLNTFVNRI